MSLLLLAGPPALADDYLTGDTKLACEALLCLSSGSRPSECNPALNRYFSIRHRKWRDTLSARKSFLRLCPDATADGRMDSLVEAIAGAAGLCSAAELNATNFKTVTERVCRDAVDENGDTYVECRNVERTVISDTLPSNCQTYASHDYTWKVTARYEGDPLKGGHWVDDAKEPD